MPRRKFDDKMALPSLTLSPILMLLVVQILQGSQEGIKMHQRNWPHNTITHQQLGMAALLNSTMCLTTSAVTARTPHLKAVTTGNYHTFVSITDTESALPSTQCTDMVGQEQQSPSPLELWSFIGTRTGQRLTKLCHQILQHHMKIIISTILGCQEQIQCIR